MSQLLEVQTERLQQMMLKGKAGAESNALQIPHFIGGKAYHKTHVCVQLFQMIRYSLQFLSADISLHWTLSPEKPNTSLTPGRR